VESNIRIALALALCLGGTALPAHGQAPQSTHPVKAIGDPVRGEALAKRWCASCHLPGANGSATDAAPSFPRVADWAQSHPDDIRTFLTRPHAPMPPLELDRVQIEDMVAYFRKLATEPH
jgi:mono/diheme cytochrome c family protein